MQKRTYLCSSCDPRYTDKVCLVVMIFFLVCSDKLSLTVVSLIRVVTVAIFTTALQLHVFQYYRHVMCEVTQKNSQDGDGKTVTSS